MERTANTRGNAIVSKDLLKKSCIIFQSVIHFATGMLSP